MDKREICAFLEESGVEYELTEHPAVYNMAEVARIQLPYDVSAKNLFVRDNKRQFYCMITVPGAKRVDLRAFRHEQGLRPLSMAPEEELQEMLCLKPGSVTPFGLLNDSRHRVTLFLDCDFQGGRIGVHPNENTATVWLRASDLVGILRNSGVDVRIVSVPAQP